MLENFVIFIKDFVEGVGYLWIFVMMTLESSFFPFPSEVAMVPAGALAYEWKMIFSLALLAWILWSLTWAMINYTIWKYLGKAFILRFWKYFFLHEENYNKVERYFITHGSVTTFIWRLLPAVRQYISFPAWVVSMNIPKFMFFTGLWAWIWSLILMVIGYIAWKNQDSIMEYKFQALLGLLLFILLLVPVYIIYHKKTSPKEA